MELRKENETEIVNEQEMDQAKKLFYDRLEQRGVSRRDFLKYCTALTASMGLAASFTAQVVHAVETAATGKKPPVIWLHFGECTGCSESFLRTPNVGAIILDTISVEYHETIMAASGYQAEKSLHDAVEHYAGKFVCIVEGSIATNYNGSYGRVGGKTFLEIAKEIIPKAAAVIALGTCAAYGGIPAAAPNPGGYKGVKDAIGLSTINITGCPPNPLNLLSTIVKYLNKEKIDLDELGRPLFAFANSVHDQCPRLKHFENDEFVLEFGSKEAELGYCLYKLGCKGPETFNNCPTAKFNDGASFPIQAGHPCIGCSEPDFWDKMTPFYEES